MWLFYSLFDCFIIFHSWEAYFSVSHVSQLPLMGTRFLRWLVILYILFSLYEFLFSGGGLVLGGGALMCVELWKYLYRVVFHWLVRTGDVQWWLHRFLCLHFAYHTSDIMRTQTTCGKGPWFPHLYLKATYPLFLLIDTFTFNLNMHTTEMWPYTLEIL